MSTKKRSRLEEMCIEKGLRMTEQRRLIAKVLSESNDHPDVETVYQRATKIDPRLGLATVYRTLRLFEDANILESHDFGDGRSRYEETSNDHHDHLIDIKTGKVIEFQNEAIEQLQHEVASNLQFELIDHSMVLYVSCRRTNCDGRRAKG